MKSNYKKYLLSVIIILTTINIYAQSVSSKGNFSFGFGNSLYKDIKTKQFIMFYDVRELTASVGNFSVNGALNLELISHNNSTTMIAGLAPIFRYDLNLGFTNTFINAGIGFNYINNHNISSRNLGGHFIFSDMISIGAGLIKTEYFTAEISYLFRHISNAGIFNNNEGFNSQYFVLSFNM